MNAALKTLLCAAAIWAVTPPLIAGQPWCVLEQPELKQALENAPVLQTESLGEPARAVNVWERWMVPNLDGKSWDALQMYFKEYYGPTWLCAVDLGTGQVRKQRLPDDHQFYLSGRALGFDGKYYIAIPSRKTWSMDLFVYDPATNTMEERGEIVPGLGGEVRPLVSGSCTVRRSARMAKCISAASDCGITPVAASAGMTPRPGRWMACGNR